MVTPNEVWKLLRRCGGDAEGNDLAQHLHRDREDRAEVRLELSRAVDALVVQGVAVRVVQPGKSVRISLTDKGRSPSSGGPED